MKTKIIIVISLIIAIQSYSQTKVEVSKIISNYDTNSINKLTKELNTKYTNLINYAKKNNIPIKFKKNEKQYSLASLIDGKPIYYTTSNLDAIKSTRAFNFHNGNSLGLNIEGQNMVAYVWDGGVARASHNEFYFNHTSKITIGDGSNDERDHATHVTGSIVAVGDNPLALGAAPQALSINYDWDNDQAEVSSATTQGMLLSNHSYGIDEPALPDWAFGAYVAESKNWDNIMFQAPYYLNVSAAGNAGNDNVSNANPLDGMSNRDKLSLVQTAKNGLVVGNANDLGVNSDGDLIGSPIINSSSSQGPTDDYRIKPDIVGNGTLVFSPISTSDSSYDSKTGTSMASPNVMGTLLLVQQLYNEINGSFMLASTLKGLALHTADDGGVIGPDPIFGWGYLNAKKCAEIIQNNESIILENTLNNSEVFSFNVTSDGTSPLIASISWTDRPNNNVNSGTPNLHTPVLVADLDIRITKNGTTFYPWKLTGANSNTQGDNIVDPFEKIEIDNASGIYTISVSHKNNLPNGHQNYSLIVNGISSNSLSLDDTSKIEVFDIWPNPTNKLLHISNYDSQGVSKISIYNLIGQEVYRNSFNSKIFTINLSEFDKGVYYVKIKNNNKSLTKKIILN